MLKKISLSPSKWCDWTHCHYGNLFVCIDRISQQCSLPCLLRGVNLFCVSALIASGKQAVVFLFTAVSLLTLSGSWVESSLRTRSCKSDLSPYCTGWQLLCQTHNQSPSLSSNCTLCCADACGERMMNGWLWSINLSPSPFVKHGMRHLKSHPSNFSWKCFDRQSTLFGHRRQTEELSSVHGSLKGTKFFLKDALYPRNCGITL